MQAILAAAKLEPEQEPTFRAWLADVDTEFLEEQERIANDLTPKQIGKKLAEGERLAAALHGLLRHPQVDHYLDVDYIRSVVDDVTRELAQEARDLLNQEIAAVAKLRTRMQIALKHVGGANPHDAAYFGKLSAEQPNIEFLIGRAWHYWQHVLRRPPTLSNRSHVVVFIQAVLAGIAGRAVAGETVRKRLAKMAKAAANSQRDKSA